MTARLLLLLRRRGVASGCVRCCVAMVVVSSTVMVVLAHGCAEKMEAALLAESAMAFLQVKVAARFVVSARFCDGREWRKKVVARRGDVQVTLAVCSREEGNGGVAEKMERHGGCGVAAVAGTRAGRASGGCRSGAEAMVVELLREKMVAMAVVMVAGEVSCGCRGCARFVVAALLQFLCGDGGGALQIGGGRGRRWWLPWFMVRRRRGWRRQLWRVEGEEKIRVRVLGDEDDDVAESKWLIW